MIFKDKTFCASPNCTNECGRKMSDEEKEFAEMWPLQVSYGMFCSSNEEIDTELYGNFINAV